MKHPNEHSHLLVRFLKQSFLLALAAVLFLATVGSVRSQTMLLHFGFDDTGTTTTDSVSSVVLNLWNSSGIATDLHTNFGVSATGKSLNYTTASMGGGGPLAWTTNNTTINFGVISNFTLTMWVNPATPLPLNAFPRYFTLGTNGIASGAVAQTLMLYNNANSSGYNNTLTLNTASIATPIGGFAIPTNQWTFLAVSYDGTNATFYHGTESSSVIQAASSAVSQTVNVGSNFSLFIGNILGRNRAFKGLFDDVRYYAGGADSNFVDAVREQAIFPAVPTNILVTGCNAASLSWSAIGGATGYIVQRSTTMGAEAFYDTARINNYLDTNVTAGTTYYYTVVATNSFNDSPASSEVSAAVQGTFTFTTQPTNVTVTCPDVSSATFLVGTSGGVGLTYQWQISTNQGSNWDDIPAATTTSYTVNPVRASDSGNQFRVQVGSTCGLTPSSTATLAVANVFPSIIAQPLPQTVVAGWPAVFAVQATGTSLTYQWRANGTNLTDSATVSGSQTPKLVLTGLTPANSGVTYDCVVSGPCGFVSSTQVQLTVNGSMSNNLMFDFGFEDASNGVVTVDSINGIDLTMLGPTGFGFDFHGQPGSGVGKRGLALDFATGSPGAQGGNGPLASVVNDTTVNWGAVNSFTLTLWANPSKALTRGLFPRYLVLGTNGTADGTANNSLMLYNSGVDTNGINNAVTLALNTNQVASSSFPEPTNQWAFLAVTYDGQTVSFYAGSESGQVSFVNSTNCAAGPINLGNAYSLFIGNNNAQIRSFAGMLDDVRFYVGAAPQSALEAIRQSVAFTQKITGTVINPDGSLILSFSGVPGNTYQVQSTTNLTQPIVWQNVSTNIADPDGKWTYTNGVKTPATFYRSVYQP